MTSAMRGVLVTGCSSGIGLVTALAFARRGDRVWATVRDPGRAADLHAAIAAAALPVTVLHLDVTDGASIARAVDRVLTTAGRLDVLVNNAGVGYMAPVEEMPEAMLREMFETNFFGVVATIRAVLPAMRAQRSGAVITVSSSAARLPGRPLLAPYAASKCAIGIISEALALELEPFGIRVRLMEPGFFKTRIGENRQRRERAAGFAARPDSPYRALREAVNRHVARHQATARDPQIVADAILAAADDPETFPVHRLVGDDAVAFVAAARTGTEAERAAEWKRIRGL